MHPTMQTTGTGKKIKKSDESEKDNKKNQNVSII